MTRSIVEQIREGFHYPTFLKHSKFCLHVLKKIAASAPSHLGGDQHGLYTLYLNHTGIDFIKPPNPGMVAKIPKNSTESQIDERVCNHKEKLRE